VIDKVMMIFQDSLDSQKDVPGSHSEACVSPSHLGNQAVSIKVEEFSHVQDEEDPVPMAVVEIKVEPEVSCVPVCQLLGIFHSHPELPVPFFLCIYDRKCPV
jgi:hypothetical protein